LRHLYSNLLPRIEFMLTEARVATCAHCGLGVPAGLIDERAPRQFCCTGCQMAYALIHEHGLERYYTFGEQRAAPVRPSGRSYEEFDHPAFQALYVRRTEAGTSAVELYVEGVHCASCVWLIERLTLLVAGVVRAELNVGRSLASIEWDASSTGLAEIARRLDALGYPPHPFRGIRRDEMRRREDRAMLVRIGVAGAIAINVMLAAVALYSGWLNGMEAEWDRFFRWISLIVVTPAFIWPGRVFFTGALAALRARTLNMDVPLALGLGAGYARGVANTVTDSGPVYFDGLATLIFALLVGRYLQLRGQRAASDSSELLFAVTPATARIVGAGGSLNNVPAEAVVPGMTLSVRAGETFAADGTVTDGASSVDTSLLTGESRARRLGPGDRVFAGTLNLGAEVRVRVDDAGESSRIARLMRLVEEHAVRRASIVQTANRLAVHFVGIVLVLAIVTWLVWKDAGASIAIDHAIALLVVTCPCALALSTPLAVSVAIGRAAGRGILIKGGDVLEALAHPARLLLDKTGTVTQSRAHIVAWRGPDDVRPLVLALEQHSSHPIAEAFRRSWPDLPAAHAEAVRLIAGAGLDGVVNGRRVLVGSPSFVAAATGAIAPLAGDGCADTPVLVAVDGVIVGEARVGDPLRDDARSAVDALRDGGWRVGILSGDAQEVVSDVARKLGVAPADGVGGASPEEKLERVLRARTRGPVVMVGDGVNDAAAMAAATVGVGVHGGAEACLQSADVYLSRPGLTPLVELMQGSQRTMRVIRRNIAFSLVYNAIGAALAMAGVLTPLIAAFLMPASSLTVVIASWRSRTFGVRP
jgi:Cu2+-exporting ATPase